MILDDRPGLAPLDSPKDILDIATGTGVWAHEIGKDTTNNQTWAAELTLDSQQPNSLRLECLARI